MSSNVTYLASRSLAVYEISLIEHYTEVHQRMIRQQALTVFGICSGFSALACLVLMVPLFVQSAVSYLSF